MEEYKIGERIREERKKCGLSQAELGEKVGISASHVGLIERGERGVTVSNLIKFVNIFGVSMDYLLRDSLYITDEILEKQICNMMENLALRDKQIIIEVIKVLKKIDEKGNE